jgi:hypothetical protein
VKALAAMVLALLALLYSAAAAALVDGTTAARKAWVTSSPANYCPASGKPLLTCTGFQLMYLDPCNPAAGFKWVKTTAYRASLIQARYPAYCACVAANPPFVVMRCLTWGCLGHAAPVPCVL